MTTLLPPGVKVHLALGYVDMRKGIDGLAMLVQGVLRQDPFTGHLFVFRGRTRANLIKILFLDGTGLCLFTKRLEYGPSASTAGGRAGWRFRPLRLDLRSAARWRSRSGSPAPPANR
jgi:transposase